MQIMINSLGFPKNDSESQWIVCRIAGDMFCTLHFAYEQIYNMVTVINRQVHETVTNCVTQEEK